jgi:hypothetical protein
LSQLRHSPEITSTTLVSDFAPWRGEGFEPLRRAPARLYGLGNGLRGFGANGKPS